jgi:hypothetical protein
MPDTKPWSISKVDGELVGHAMLVEHVIDVTGQVDGDRSSDVVRVMCMPSSFLRSPRSLILNRQCAY